MPTSCENLIQGIQNKNKVNTNEIIEKFKIYPKRKYWMNIPLCRLMAMPIVRFVLKIHVLKMEQAFQMGYMQGEKMFFVSPTN
jgi:hypothetical protein